MTALAPGTCRAVGAAPARLEKVVNMVRNAVPASGEEHRSDLVEVGTLPTNKQNEGVQRKTHRRQKPRSLQQRLGKLRPEARLRGRRGASPRVLLMWGK